MKLKKIKIKTNSQEYSIIIGFDVISKIKKIIHENSIEFKKCFLIVDKKVPKKFINILRKKLQNKELYFYLFDANEKNKNQKTINYILDILLKRNFSRKDCIIAMGGGITGDVGGFAASIFKRGMQFINIPTTLLSQVDSSIGGKTGINSKHGKNLIGSFYQPNLVISDSKFLKSLPKREIKCGYAEILKHSLISNKKFFKFLKKNVIDILNIKSPLLESAIYESCKIKKLIVEKDEKEKNLRKVLNFGHTFAHAFEATLGYSKKLNHGEAVSLGIKTAIEFSYRKKLIKAKEYISIKNHIKKSNLPYDLKKYFSLKDLETGISIMKIAEELDSGPISNIYKIKIDRNDNSQEISEKLSLLAAEKILDNIDEILEGKVKFVEQDHSKATYAKKINKSEGQINWNDDVLQIIGKINGLFPNPGAYFNFNGERYKILKAEIGNSAGKVGEVLSDKLEIACSNNKSLKIIEIQRQGKKPQLFS